MASSSLRVSLLSANSMFLINSSRRYSSLEERRLLKSNVLFLAVSNFEGDDSNESQYEHGKGSIGHCLGCLQ